MSADYDTYDTWPDPFSDVPWPEPPAGQPLTANAAVRLGQLRNALLDSDALDSLPGLDPLVDGILYRDSLAWLHGKPGHGKSFVALDIACCVSAGLPWQMHGVTQGPVLYVIAEGVTGLRQRVRAWEQHAHIRTGVKFLPVAVQLPIDWEADALAALAGEIKPVLIVIDTQARVTVGADENSARDMGVLVAAIDKIRPASRACILTVHHESRAGENMRGSTALEGAALTQMRCTREGGKLEVTCIKQKDATDFDPIRLRLTPCGDSVVVTTPGKGEIAAELNASEQGVIDILRGVFGATGASGSRLLEVCGQPKSTFYWALNRLTETGRVVNVGSKTRTHYLLAEHVEPAQSPMGAIGLGEKAAS
jgi:AAA domain